jgi:hypothetical protein
VKFKVAKNMEQESLKLKKGIFTLVNGIMISMMEKEFSSTTMDKDMKVK